MTTVTFPRASSDISATGARRSPSYGFRRFSRSLSRNCGCLPPVKIRRRGKGPSTILAAFGVARPEPTAQALQGPVKIPRSWLSVAQTPEPQAQSKKQRLRACTNIKYILGTRGRIMDGWMHACMDGWMDGRMGCMGWTYIIQLIAFVYVQHGRVHVSATSAM